MQRFRIGAVTDVFSPDIMMASRVMHDVGLQGAELRIVDRIDDAVRVLHAKELEISAVASPLLKCSLDDDGAARAFEIAKLSGAPIIRVFSGPRVEEPATVFEQLVDVLQNLTDQAEQFGLIVGLENDHTCNVATGSEIAAVLAAIDHPNLQVVWDPASAYIAGEKPFPSGYQMLDPTRIALVHAKDCTLDGHKPVRVPIGEGDIDWQGQIDALADDHYQGFIDIETYWPQVNECIRNLKRISRMELRL